MSIVEIFFATVGVTFVLWFALIVLFTPRIDYRVSAPLAPASDGFVHVIQPTCHAVIQPGNRVELLTNGERFYPAMLGAIRAAQTSVNFEAYILYPGEVADAFVAALEERARAGVEVRVVLDSVGSSRMGGRSARRLRAAGCRVYFYQSVNLYRLHRLNNRTHRELLIVDGAVAFTGGAGVADWWAKPHRGRPAWRDTMVRLEGPIVTDLQGVFAENWLECSGEILAGSRHWPRLAHVGTTDALLVKSSPSDRATEARVVFQMLIEGAVSDITMATPYFLPDRSFRHALARAARRGVRVRVLVPGRLTDQRLVRLASRRLYGELLEAGVRMFEYRPAMTHVKSLIVDGTWAMVGTANIDNRSFEHNDEINIALRGAATMDRLRAEFERDLEASDEVTSTSWNARRRLEKLVEPVCWLLERQQ